MRFEESTAIADTLLRLPKFAEAAKPKSGPPEAFRRSTRTPVAASPATSTCSEGPGFWMAIAWIVAVLPTKTDATPELPQVESKSTGVGPAGSTNCATLAPLDVS